MAFEDLTEGEYSLGVRMKKYERVTRTELMSHSLTILRVDGRAFHSYLGRASKPFDFEFIANMQEVARVLCREISGTVFAYGQSDEISLLISDIPPQAQQWFGGVVQKMVSVSASLATAALIARRGVERGLPTFDSRVFHVPSWTEAGNYFVWRQRDAVRNSISMAAQAVFTHDELLYQNSGSMQEMLWKRNINWNDYPESAKRGWCVSRQIRKADVTYTDRRTQALVSTVAERTFWEVTTPQLTVDSPLLFVPSFPETGEPSDGLAMAQEAPATS